MPVLMRAPQESGSWTWDLSGVDAPGLDSALGVAARVAKALADHSLLDPAKIECDWIVPEIGGIGVTTILGLTVPLGDSRLPERVMQSRPVGFPSAEVDDIRIPGNGMWIDAGNRRRGEPRLVEVSVSPDPTGPWVELSVHHDIWAWFDFHGRAHPEVYRNNAPRLEAALKEVDSVLGMAAETGEPTYFGSAKGYGITPPEPNKDGTGPDVTDLF